MTDDLVPMQYAAGGVQARTPLAPAAWGGAPAPAPAAAKPSIGRILSAMRRYKWLMLGIVVLGSVGGGIATTLVKPKYVANATIFVASETPLSGGDGPIQSQELLNSEAWVDLLRSYRISDAVVVKHALFVKPKEAADSVAFRGFALGQRFAPGDYTLELDGRTRKFLLSLKGIAVDRGAVGDSIGRPVGFGWAPTPQQLRAGKDSRTIEFTLATPRETSIQLINRLSPRLEKGSPLLQLQLEDTDPKRAAAILNSWAHEYVAVAGDLKKRNINEFASILRDQLAFAEQNLREAEASLQNFRVSTITLPSENAPVAAGIEMTQNSALSGFFSRKVEADNLRNDRETLEALIERAKGNPVALEGAMLIPNVAQGTNGSALKAAFEDLTKKRAELAAARQTFTDEYRPVQMLAGAIRTLETETIPRLLQQSLATLQEREAQSARRIEGQTADLRQIPTRTIEEMRLRRRVMVAEQLYTSLNSRYANAHLAEASTTPDVSILDSAIAPLRPSSDTSLGMLGASILGSLGAAIALAFLLDKADRKVRYPEHASSELGLAIVGTVPTLPKPGAAAPTPESVAQVVESFRSIRLSLVHAMAGGQQMFAVTSAGPGEGKSLICSNLALSFAEAGFRTVLVDGDTRRGALHSVFGAPMHDGLTDYLAGDATLEQALHPTTSDRLLLMPRGTRRRRGPELLTSPAMMQLVNELRARADLVIFDTPPLAAGIDAFAIGTAATHALMVLRLGKTDRKLANAKLELMDRLPVQMLGAVLNDVKLEGEYQYYSYLEGYYSDADDVRAARVEEAPAGELVEQT